MGAGDWIFPDPAEPLLYHEVSALMFLRSSGPHCIGTIETEDQFAAAIVFEGLKRRGHVIAALGDTGPVYRITPKGISALSNAPEAA